MSHKKRLEENLAKFYEEMNERLEKLSPAEQQQYLEGLVHAFDAMTRLARMPELSPFGRENFIASAKSAAYSQADHLNLDTETKMKPLIESDHEHMTAAFLFAAGLSRTMGYTLDEEDVIHLSDLLGFLRLKSIK